MNVWRSRRKTWSSGSVLYTVRNLRKGAFLSAVMYWRLETTGYSLFQLQRCGSTRIYSKVVCCAPGTRGLPWLIAGRYVGGSCLDRRGCAGGGVQCGVLHPVQFLQTVLAHYSDRFVAVLHDLCM